MKFLFLLLLLPMSFAWSGIYVNNLWKNYEVTTCFAEAHDEPPMLVPYPLKVRAWKEKNKEKVIRWISEEYTLERTGIHFTGFDDCHSTPYADVVIFYNKNNVIENFFNGISVHGFASIGPSRGIVTGYPMASSFVVLSKTKMKRSAAVHEFGHVAGLDHEHTHPDAYSEDKGKCSLISQYNPQLSFRIYESYDKDSVMNYCKVEDAHYKVGLSSNDIKLLKKMYP